MDLDAAEERIVHLERMLHCGVDDHEDHDDDLTGMNLTNRAQTLAQQINAAEQEHLVTIKKYQAVKELLTYKHRLGKQAKLDLVVASEADLRATFELLREVEELAKDIDIPNLEKLGEHEKRLAPLEPVHLDQKETFAQTSAGVNNLLARYNANMQTLSELFLYWDQVLTRLEVQVNRQYNEKFS